MSGPITKANAPKFVVPSEEQEMRRLAVDPGLSVFLTANAGSGKTTILTERVIRLLLGGAEPSRILCLTYTKAAAAEMQDRIFKTLGAWVRHDDATLGAEITRLTGGCTAGELARARSLFARAVETPGGLKIQTIHAFAERLLHLFPFEANTPARFAVMDDPAKAELLERARRATIRDAMAAPESALGAAFMALADTLAEDTFNGLIAAAMPLLRNTRGLKGPQDWRALMAAALDLDPKDTGESVAEAMIAATFPASEWPEAMAGLQNVPEPLRKRDDKSFMARLARCIAAGDAPSRAWALAELLLNDAGGPRKTLLNKDAAALLPELAAKLADAAEAAQNWLERLKRIRTLERSLSLMVVAADIQRRYRAEKARGALVDFDDMIDRALALVTSRDGASWVLMKLDGGIDHVLIDEAQDTTPEMWQIVQALTGEFFAGAGARQVKRTVFAVGDEKQSIYSFQGARPEAFAETRRHYAKAISEANQTFEHRELKLSFRTVIDVLNAVDAVFSAPQRFDGLSSDPVGTVHETARVGAPGVVELWPLVEPAKNEPEDPWVEVDALEESSAPVRLAEMLADDIANLVAGERYESDGAPVSAGDIMILVQRRDAFFEAVIRALKRRNVAVAGADRVKLTEEIAVMDLISAAKTALMPEDDLALAEVLKSPLLGLDDDDLIALAPGRSGSLYAALAENPQYAEVWQTIEHWRALARSNTPYEFFSALLGPLGGRRKLLARLGPDAADGIEMFLAGVLNRETREPPSLVAEIAAFSTLTTDVKRDQEQAGAAVRVLTVHGAKGLEARIVYLPDANRLPLMKEPGLFPHDHELDPDSRVLLWSAKKEDRPESLAARRAAQELARMQEYRRLFYVAMTRAKERLVIAGWGKLEDMKPAREPRPNSKDRCWYKMAHDAFGESTASVQARELGDGRTVQRWRKSAEIAAPDAPPETKTSPAPAALPAWLHAPVPVEPQTLPPLRPSRVLDAADQRITPERDAARQRGDLIHLLLERLPALPAETRADAAAAMLAGLAPRMPEDERERIATRVLALMADPALAPLFGPGSRGEVPVAGDVTLPSGKVRAVLGRMDRIAVLDGRILLADFKTGRGTARQNAVTQLALYRALLTRIYPEKPVEALLIWTADGRVDSVSAAEMDRAFNVL